MIVKKGANARFLKYGRNIPQDLFPSHKLLDDSVRIAALAFLVLIGTVFFLSGAFGGPQVIPTVLGVTETVAVNILR